MRYLVLVNALALAGAVSIGPVSAQSSSGSSASTATEAARAITSDVQTQPEPVGKANHTGIILTGPLTRQPIVSPKSGSDCIGAYAAASDVARTPMNSAGALAPNSLPLLVLPIEPVRSGYLTDVRTATERAAIPGACAHH